MDRRTLTEAGRERRKDASDSSPPPLSRSLKLCLAVAFPSFPSVRWRIIEVWVAMIVVSPAS